MKEMITFLYLFKSEPQLLPSDAAYRIVDQELKYRGNDWGVHMRFKFHKLFFYENEERKPHFYLR